jgi:hypothetical protein
MRRGSALILVLFVLGVLSLVAASFSYRAGLENRLAGQTEIIARLRCHASSAGAIALARLAAEENDFDHPAEPWCSHGPLSEEGWLNDWSAADSGEAAAFVTDYQVIDEAGKLHVSYASGEAMEALGMTAEQIDGLFDWMDSDSVRRSEGAETEHYQQWDGYRCKDAPLEMLDELLWVSGFTASDYYGGDWGRYRFLPEPGPLPAEAREDVGSLAQPGWVDLLTCLGDGRINLNTTPEAVLRTFPLSEAGVGQLLGYREFDADRSGKVEDHAFRSETDIDQLQGLSRSDREILKGIGRFSSEYFRILVCSRHLKSGMTFRLDVLVRMRDGTPEILQWKSGRNAG